MRYMSLLDFINCSAIFDPKYVFIIFIAKYTLSSGDNNLFFNSAPFPSPLLENGVGTPLIVANLDGAWLPNFDFS